ncbi:glutaredoxin 2 [Shewanella litorisediminis]|uniref:Glutaredoxin 2 n=1 Tax=Shewanella litorisediminis TaxID=1173586 RepID=A0ABX7G0T8_9GAMM|nr:glutaredoxin 2 [Shewanella litorisediminis]MCL2918110.1 glutaredoxin 2 [Shewanella litorisediminis]QRH00832.1 glutaredoxin 2 [Shewanella litorisediminis]
MKLFVFEHCPYCVRAMMAAGYKGIALEKVILQNDDVDSRIRMVGANMVPILQKDDGSYMAESLDIVAYLDAVGGEALLKPAEHEQHIAAWLDKAAYYSSRLLHPRNVRLGLPEYGSEAAVRWYTEKKSALIGMSFDEAFAASAEYMAALEPLFGELDFMLLPSERNNQLGYDDILLFPVLRNLTAVKGLNYGEHIRRYVDEVAELTGVALFDGIAI